MGKSTAPVHADWEQTLVDVGWCIDDAEELLWVELWEHPTERVKEAYALLKDALTMLSEAGIHVGVQYK